MEWASSPLLVASALAHYGTCSASQSLLSPAARSHLIIPFVQADYDTKLM